MGQLSEINYMVEVHTVDDFFEKLHKIGSGEKKIGNLILLGHGSQETPFITLSEEPVQVQLNPDDIDIDNDMRYLRSAIESRISNRLKYYTLKYKKELSEEEKSDLELAEKRLESYDDNIRPDLIRRIDNLDRFEKVRTIMAPDARILLLVCSAAATAEHRKFVNNLGKVLLGQKGGAIVASKQDITVPQAAGEGDSVASALWGEVKWIATILKSGQWVNPGDFAPLGSGVDPKKASFFNYGNWTTMRISSDEDTTPYYNPLLVEAEPSSAEVFQGQKAKLSVKVKKAFDSGKLTYYWNFSNKGSSEASYVFDAGPYDEKLVNVRVEIQDEKGRKGYDNVFIFVKKQEYTVDISLSNAKPAKDEVINAKALCVRGTLPKESLWRWVASGGAQIMPRGDGTKNNEAKVKVTGQGKVTAVLYYLGDFGKEHVLACVEKGIMAGKESTPEPSPSPSPTPSPTGIPSQEPGSSAQQRYQEHFAPEAKKLHNWLIDALKYLDALKELDTRVFSGFPSRCRPDADEDRHSARGKGGGKVMTKEELLALYKKKCIAWASTRHKDEQKKMNAAKAAINGSGLLDFSSSCEASGDYKGYVNKVEALKKKLPYPVPDPVPPSVSLTDNYYHSCGFFEDKPGAAPVAITPSEKPSPTEESEPLSVELEASKAKLAPGEESKVTARVKGGKGPYSYAWNDGSPGSTSSHLFSSAKPGEYTVKASVTDSKGKKASKELSLIVGDLTVTIEMTGGARTITLGETAQFKAALTSGGKPVTGSFVFRWQSDTKDSFDPGEGAASQSKVRFTRPGKVKAWVEVLAKKGSALTPAGESEQLEAEVAAPALSLEFSPSSPQVGKEVKAKLKTVPLFNECEARWELSRNAKLLSESKDTKEIVFLLLDSTPASLTARVRTPHYGDDLGDASGTIQASSYKVSVTVLGPSGPPPKVWKEGKGLVDAPGEIAVFQDVRLRADIEPLPEGSLRYQWSLNSGSSFSGNSSAKETAAQRSEVGTCQATVSVKNADGMVLGSGSGSFSVTISQEALKKGKAAEEAAGRSKNLAGLMKEAAGKQETKDYKGAIADYTKALDINSSLAEAWHMRGVCKGETGDSRGAVEDYSRAIALTPGNAVIWYDRGLDKRKMNDLAGAISDYSEVIRLRPDYTSAYYNRAIALRMLGRHQEAIKDFTRAVELDPRKYTSWCGRGLSKEETGDLEGALADIRKALEIKPDDATSLAALARLQKKAEPLSVTLSPSEVKVKTGEKITLDAQASGGKPPYRYEWYAGPARDEKASGPRVTWTFDKPQQFIISVKVKDSAGNEESTAGTVAVEGAAKTSRSEAIKYYLQGVTKNKEGKFSEAIENFNRAIELEPDFASAYADRAYSKNSIKDFRDAAEDSCKAITFRNNTALPDELKVLKYYLVYNILGYSYDELGDYRKAIDIYTEGIRLKPDYQSLYRNRGVVYCHLGEHKKAIEDFNEAIRLKPEARYYAARGRCWMHLGDKEKALADSQKALEIDPADNIAKGVIRDIGSQNVKPLTVTLSPQEVNAKTGEKITLEARANGGTPPYTYEWFDNRSREDIVSTPSISWTPSRPRQFTESVVVTDSTGSRARAECAVSVHHEAAPAQEPAAPASPASPLTVTLDPPELSGPQGLKVSLVAHPSGGVPPYTYEWYENGQMETELYRSSIQWNLGSPGKYTESVIVRDSAGTTAQANCTVTVQQKAAPAASAQPLTVTLDPPALSGPTGLKVSLVAKPRGGVPPYTYEWYWNGQKETELSQSSIQWTLGNPRQYTESVIVRDSAGTTAQANCTVSVEERPEPTVKPKIEEFGVKLVLSAEDSACLSKDTIYAGETIEIEAKIIKGGRPPFRYEWFFEGKKDEKLNNMDAIEINLKKLGPREVTVRVTDSKDFSIDVPMKFTVVKREDTSPGPAPTSEQIRYVSNFAGTWDTNWGRMVLKVEGVSVYGNYTHDKGRIKATLSNDGRTLTGYWSEAPSYRPSKDAGRVTLTISSDGNSLYGTWGYDKSLDGGDWTGKRISR
ncbi:MAG: tetratricopeptide repeat protein [Candidatus Eremiobacteraeota bacterium]|nr:tetratricopeptide repeat protein [Candidatus Eremiobacteraeota bacterium]